ncbi:conserved hypothetical protein [Lebetimonas natsushimae]|uniref:Right handed beta helix domain-containing protein n=1 Tax=Lebetimonas natsushimae TaxID=1936991 RepID=A0A292YCF9_9BACT|nr:H-type lectin domain-containing protein [Lebetimonas natsushimae]GAX87070.1 conserved hypothetical protein [Lebetimonas natsushimae]
MRKIVFLIFILNILFADTLVVDKDTNNPCVSGDNYYSSIQDAMNHASNGDIIKICPGEYDESIEWKHQNITLEGASGNRDDVKVVANSGKNAIYSNINPANVTIKYITFKSDNKKGIYFDKKVNGKLIISDINITSKEEALLVDLDIDDNVNISNSVFNSKEESGIHFKGNLKGNLLISDINITSEKESFLVDNEVGKDVEIKDSFFHSNNEIGIYFDENIKGNLKVFDVNITSEKEGFRVDNKIDGNVNINNTDFKSNKETSLLFKGRVGGDVNLSNSIFKSNEKKGIYFDLDIKGSLTIYDVNVSSKEEGFLIDNGVNDVKIKFSEFNSTEKDGAKLKLDDDTSVEIKNNHFKTDDDGSYGLTIDMRNSDDVHINNNCFYGKDVNHLACTNGKNYDWNNNYWDGFSGDTYKNDDCNIEDDNPLLSCQNLECKISSDITITPLEFEGGTLIIENTYETPQWTHVDFNKSFSEPPVVFVIADVNGSQPAAPRIRNITSTGFDVIMAEPQGEDGPHYTQSVSYLAVNKGIHKIGNTYIQVGTLNTKKYQQHSTGKKTLDVDEWEKIDTIFSECKPVVVAGIQTLNNEVGLDRHEDGKIIRSIPFLTTAIDVNDSGVYLSLERSETHESTFKHDGVINNKETIGYMIAPANIQDSVVDDYGHKILFETIRKENYFVGWDNECKSVNFRNKYNSVPLIAANKNSKNGIDGGWFRRCVLDKTKVGFKIDEDGSSSSKEEYDYNSSYQDKERKHIEETGGIFVFSGNIVIRETPSKTYKFDAWDINRNINDRNISTKIVNKEFDVTIASLNENGDALQEFNGTVCSKITSDNYNSNWNKALWNNEKEKNISFKIPNAIKKAKVTIQWKEHADVNCPVNDGNESNSSDDFAVRPNKFVITNIPSKIIAGKEFNITLKALDYENIPAKDYNETVNINGNSPDLEYNISKINCDNGDLEIVNGGDFKNGEANITLKYSEVGNVDLTLKEVNGSEFAKVDSDDTSLNNRLILAYKTKISVNPDHFKISANLSNYDDNFTYLDNGLNLYSILDINITAENKDNEITKNYNKDCYAKDIDINISKIFTPEPNLNNLIYYYKDAGNNTSEKSVQDINKTIQIHYKDTNFTTEDNGSTRITLFINFDRNSSKTVNPFDMNISEINVSDGSTNGKMQKIGKALYYYGNLVLFDEIANRDEFDTRDDYFIVYDNNGSDDKLPSNNAVLPEWYLNGFHKSKDGNISGMVVSSDYNASNQINGVEVSVNSINNGKVTFHIKRTDTSINFAVIHLLEPSLKWLWYSKYGDEYNISNDSSCVNHFCFTITWENSNENGIIKSGVITGTESNTTENNVTKRGVKIFR